MHVLAELEAATRCARQTVPTHLHNPAVIKYVPSKDCAAGKNEVDLGRVCLVQLLARAQHLSATLLVQEEECMVQDVVFSREALWLEVN